MLSIKLVWCSLARPAERGGGGGANCPGLSLGPRLFWGGNITVFGSKYLCFGEFKGLPLLGPLPRTVSTELLELSSRNKVRALVYNALTPYR